MISDILKTRLAKDRPMTSITLRIPGTREPVLSNLPYILPYRVRNDTIGILRLFHTARQPSRA